MARVKGLFQSIRTYPFEIKILSISYFATTPNSRTNKKNKSAYLATGIAKEVVDGKNDPLNKCEFPFELWLSEEQYKNKIIHKNDTVKVSENVWWVSKGHFAHRVYDRSLLSKVSPKNIKFDYNGTPYYLEMVYRFCLTIPEKEWKLFDTISQDNIAKLGNDEEHTIIIDFDTKKELINFNGGCFHLENFEYEKIKDYQDKEVSFMPFVQRIPLEEKKFVVSLRFDETAKFWILELKKI